MTKKVYGNLYVHRDFVKTLPEEAQQLVAQALPLVPCGRGWNLVRVDPVNRDLSFSLYPDFDESPHPSLRSWTKITLPTGTVKSGSYSGDNPFILHHKETFVSEADKEYGKYRRLSLQEEAAGLYAPQHSSLIGRKKYWENLLFEKSLVITNYNLEKGNPPRPLESQPGLFGEEETAIPTAEATVMSGKTAMHRGEPSLPAKILVERKIVKGPIFDWGCGHGTDLAYFKKMGLLAEGWDPNHRPEKPPQNYPAGTFKFVYCGYVLNTLPDGESRVGVLKEIYDFLPVGGGLGVAVRSAGEIESVRKETWRRYGDGWLTGKATFQKGFTAEELKQLLAKAGFTGEQVILEEPVVFILAGKESGIRLEERK